MDDNKSSVLRRLAALEAEASGAVTPSSSSAPSLQQEWKAMTKKKGKSRHQKPCFGPAMCNNALCDHRVVVPFVPAREEQDKDDKLLSLMREKSKADGYLISEKYGRAFLRRCEGKIVPALKAIKADIDSREAAMKSTGRIHWEKEQLLAGARYRGRGVTVSDPEPRDERISFLEYDDRELQLMLESGWNSLYGRTTKEEYPCPREAKKAFKATIEAAKIRNRRAEYYTGVRKQGISQGELNCLMDKWDGDNNNTDYIDYFENQPRVVGEPMVSTKEADNADQPAEEGEENPNSFLVEEGGTEVQAEQEDADGKGATVVEEENVLPEVGYTPEEINTNEASRAGEEGLGKYPEETIGQMRDFLLMLDTSSRQFLEQVVFLQMTVGGGSLDTLDIPENDILNFIAATDVIDPTISAYILAMCGNNFDRAMAFYRALHRELILHLYRNGVVIIQHNNFHQELLRFVEMFWICMSPMCRRLPRAAGSTSN